MLPENLRQQAAKRLVENIKEYKDHLTTGFLGTPYLCHVLSRFGYADVAYNLLLQDTYPSWLYPVKMGATTIWERWDGIKPDSTFQNESMNSFNHYSYGAVGDWMYRVMAGINSDSTYTGYKRIIIAPKPNSKFSFVNAELETMYGKVKSGWRLNNKALSVDVTVPANTTATIVLPKAASANISDGHSVIDENKALQKTTRGEDVSINVGSGTYHFEYTLL
jgi:alpha-L-rhamnosidase